MEFKVIELKDAKIDIIDGDRGKNYPKKTEMSNQGHTLFLNNKNIINDYLDVTTGEFITEYKSNELRKGKLIRDDIVMSTRGSVGNIGHYSEDIALNNIRINSGMVILRNKNVEINTKYLYILLKSSYMKKQYLELISGSVQNQLPIRDLQHIKLRIPQLINQKKIVQIINNLEQKIFLNRKIISNLEQLSHALFIQWFIDFEFPNEEGLPYKSSGGEMVESELGEIPKRWSVGEIDNLGTIIGGGTPSKKYDEYYTDNGISWITPKDLSNDKNTFIYKGAIDITELGLKKGSARILQKDTVLFSSRAPIGYIAIAGKEVTTNQGFKSIVPDKGYSSYFIYHLLKFKLPMIEAAAGGSTFKEISGKGLKEIPVTLPSVELVNKYKEIVEPLFLQIQMLEKENKNLTQLRDTLLPKLLSGEIEIPDELEV